MVLPVPARPGGRIVIPISEPFGNRALVLVTKTADGGVTQRDMQSVAHVPLVEGKLCHSVKASYRTARGFGNSPGLQHRADKVGLGI
jgi:hypothetical protein